LGESRSECPEYKRNGETASGPACLRLERSHQRRAVPQRKGRDSDLSTIAEKTQHLVDGTGALANSFG
jgi:hypothetical protein